jgi:hypothetical protein
LPVDLDTEHVVSRSERITWLICMLFIAVKAIARGGSNDLLRFVSESYRDNCATYELDGATIDVLDSFSSVRAMLQHLDRYADQQQHQATAAKSLISYRNCGKRHAPDRLTHCQSARETYSPGRS